MNYNASHSQRNDHGFLFRLIFSIIYIPIRLTLAIPLLFWSYKSTSRRRYTEQHHPFANFLLHVWFAFLLVLVHVVLKTLAGV